MANVFRFDQGRRRPHNPLCGPNNVEVVVTASVEDLKKLPLRAIVAYAVRWAERVRPGLGYSEPTIDDERQRAVDVAINNAKAFAEGTNDPEDPRRAMPMAKKAKAMAMEAANVVDPAENTRAGYAARTAALAAETLAQALCAFAPPYSPQADDILAEDDPLVITIDGAAMMAHSAADCAQFLLRQCGFEEESTDDYATLVELSTQQSDRIGILVDSNALGPLWHGDPPNWSSTNC